MKKDLNKKNIYIPLNLSKHLKKLLISGQSGGPLDLIKVGRMSNNISNFGGSFETLIMTSKITTNAKNFENIKLAKTCIASPYIKTPY